MTPLRQDVKNNQWLLEACGPPAWAKIIRAAVVFERDGPSGPHSQPGVRVKNEISLD